MAAGGGGSSCGSQPLPAAQHYPTTRLGAPLTLPPLPPPSGPGPRGGRGAVTRTAAAVGGSHSSGRCVGGAGRGGGGLVGTARTASSCHPCGPWTASCSCRRTWPARTHTAAAFRGDEAERRRTPRERSDPREDRFLIVDKNFSSILPPIVCRLLICARLARHRSGQHHCPLLGRELSTISQGSDRGIDRRARRSRRRRWSAAPLPPPSYHRVHDGARPRMPPPPSSPRPPETSAVATKLLLLFYTTASPREPSQPRVVVFAHLYLHTVCQRALACVSSASAV